jgi:phospholipase/carboxylesterase
MTRERPPLRFLAGLALTVAVIGLAWAGGHRAGRVVVNPSGLPTWEIGEGRRLLVLLHGYGSSPQGWMPFVATIRPGPDRRFVLPEAPEATVPPDGPSDGRAWWRLDLASYLQPGRPLPDLSRAAPIGLSRARRGVAALLTDVEHRLGAPPDDTILGGFSQGAIVSADLAFESSRPLKALVLLSPTVVEEARWEKGFAGRRGLRVFVAHGRQDDTLSYAITERFAHRLQAAGLDVTWYPFDAGHDIPADVVAALNTFLASLETARPAGTGGAGTPGH